MFNSHQEKSMPHFTWGDWHSYGKNLDTVTHNINVTGNNVRQEAAQMRHSVSNTMSWKLKDTNQKLGDRINEVDQWFRNLDRTLKEVSDAVDRLSEAKQEVERSIGKNLPLLETAKEVLNLRDRRRNVDLLEDEAYYEVKKEVDLIYKVNESFREVAHHDWDHLLELKGHRDRLEADLRDKDSTLNTDRFQLSLTPADTHIISLKPWPTDACSAGECPVSLETWLQTCQDKRRKAEEAVARAGTATNDSWNVMRRSDNDIHHQREATQFALRKRRHETQQARDHLAAQQKDLKAEIERLDREMLEVEQDTNTTRGNLKLVQTRLENRKTRPRMELVRDNPTLSLEEEFRHVVESREYLAQKLRDIKNTQNRLREHLHEVEDDLQRKERSLAIETSSLEIHDTPTKSPYQTDLSWLAPNSNQYRNQVVDRGANQRLVDQNKRDFIPHGGDLEYQLID